MMCIIFYTVIYVQNKIVQFTHYSDPRKTHSFMHKKNFKIKTLKKYLPDVSKTVEILYSLYHWQVIISFLFSYVKRILRGYNLG